MGPRMDQPRLRMSTPVEILTTIPYLLGHEPHDSVVVIGLHAPRGRLGLTQRLDLPPDEYAATAVTQMVGNAAAAGAQRVLLAIFRDEVTPLDPHHPADVAMHAALQQACTEFTLEIKDALTVRGGLWRSLECTSNRCCSPAGEPLPVRDGDDPAVLRVAAAFTLAGANVLPDRESVIATLAPASPFQRERLDTPLDRAETDLLDAVRRDGQTAFATRRPAWQARIAAAVARTSADPASAFRPDEAARVLVSLLDMPTRDVAADLCQREPEPAYAYFRELLRHAPDAYLAPPATLTAIAAWAKGDGPLATTAVEEALRADPDYRLAGLLRQLIEHGIRFPRANATGSRRRRKRIAR